MSRFLKAIQRYKPDQDENEDKLTEKDLKRWGLEGLKLRPYQLQGVQWLSQRFASMEGCILGDEMGLGKTCQTISLIVFAQGCLGRQGPFLVICPLTILDNWKQELQNLCPSLSVVSYIGDKEQRKELQSDLNGEKHFHVLLTTYEICMKDAQILRRWKWDILIVDEAHRLKNQMSKLHQTLSEFSVGFRLLLTGTPIQNNLKEIYSLLTFIQPSVFPSDATEEFDNTYADVQTKPTLAEELHQVLQPFLLRRVKADVAVDLPSKADLVIYHGMSALQKKLYISILEKDLNEVLSDRGRKRNLMNILMDLRKCVNHPYLFEGVESEPFVAGEHLVEASGKLILLDAMLAYLQKGGHRVLLFSQMTRMLNILQDYLEFRGYSYERLDGSVRAEERNLAIKDFCTKNIFVCLLSTKAGGVGLNLTAADTVIFTDIDFNPQNDLQAAARAHRIGQTRPVKVIRLLGRDTVEDVIYSRAVSKLLLTKTVIDMGHFSMLDQAQPATTSSEISEICKFGVDKMLKTEESTVEDVNLEQILGHSRNGQWVMDYIYVKPRNEDEDEEKENEAPNHMYFFEGKDYSKKPSAEDETAIQLLLERQLAQQEDSVDEGPSLRHKNKDIQPGLLPAPTRKRRRLTEFELEQRRLKKEENAAKKAKLEIEKKQKREEQKYKRKIEWWTSCGYRSLCLTFADSEGEDVEDKEEDESSVSSEDSVHNTIHYVRGDVTYPQADREDAIVVHCVDDSGWWGHGGLFSALEMRTDEARKQYEFAGDMEDLELGNVLLFQIDDKKCRLRGKDYLALIVAQHRGKANKPSGIDLTVLEEGLKKIYRAAKRMKASVHLPRIGHNTKGFNWYGTERLIHKHLASAGTPTFIYYYNQKVSKPLMMATFESDAMPSTSKAALTALASSYTPSNTPLLEAAFRSEDFLENTSGSSSSGGSPGLPDFMKDVHVFFYNIAAEERKKLARYLLTFDGDDEDIMSALVTHVVAEVETPVHNKDMQDLKDKYPQVLIVNTNWLDSCFVNQRKVSVTKYIHKL